MIPPEVISSHIQANLHDYTFGVEKLSIILQISPSYLRELAHLYFEKCPHALIESRRLEEAIRLMNSNMPIHAIGKQVGFFSVRTFRRAFSNHLGMTPSHYRINMIRVACSYPN